MADGHPRRHPELAAPHEGAAYDTVLIHYTGTLDAHKEISHLLDRLEAFADQSYAHEIVRETVAMIQRLVADRNKKWARP